MAGRRVEWCFLGSVPYDDGVRLQEKVRRALKDGEGPERLLLLEHPPVFTLGRNAGDGEITADAEWLAQRGIAVHESDRGGQATYHGPGQLVGYPILNLSPDRRDVRRYVADLCEVLVRTLAELGVEAAPRPSPHVGVWVGEEKIVSLGVHLSRWITTHGFALNVTTDVSAFGGIVPCGLPGISLTSIARLTGVAWTVEEVARRLVPHFADVFERELIEAAPPAEPFAAAPTAQAVSVAAE
ncbi:MAG TPA: lipoyl(octanoyl) transferase LipB [Thermoanaerobaculia bacterium]|jgi:lipoyl(octanoyl) transferase|nr:lipoyl(octanoyl) transferase LipB [Thermoanaerobaculia bacterium]